jgi:hypothetical protein
MGMRKTRIVALVAAMAVALNVVPASPHIPVPLLEHLVPSVSAATGGPVILDGTDPGDHGSWNGTAVVGQWLYVKKVYENLNKAIPAAYKNVSNKRIAVIGAADSTSSAYGDPGAAAHYAAQTMSPVLSVNYYNGAAAISTFFAGVEQGTIKPALIHIVDRDSLRNALDSSEQTAVNAAANAIAIHVNRGGALFANTGNYGWLTTLFPSLGTTSDHGGALQLTSSGQTAFPGLTNADIRAQWHNGFSNTATTWPLAVLATENSANGILGGSSVTLPSSVTVTATPSGSLTGGSVCLVVNVKRGNPSVNVAGATVTFSLRGVNTAVRIAAAITDTNGNTPSRCFTGTIAGTDTITARAVNTSDSANLGEGNVAVTWSHPPSEVTITPASSALTVGNNACFVVKVRRGTPLTAFAGATVTFAVTGAGAGTTIASGTTNTSGETTSKCFKSTIAGNSTITATARRTSPSPIITLGTASATVVWAAVATTTTTTTTTSTTSTTTTTTVPATTTTTAPSLIPNAPSNVKGESGNTQIPLTWSPPSPLPVSPVTDYLIRYSSDFGKTWTTFADGISAAASTLVTGLTNGTQYAFQVAAVNAYGTSPWSVSSAGVWALPPATTTLPTTTTTTIPRTVPRPPGILKPTAGAGRITLTWQTGTPAPLDPVTDFIVEYSSDFGKTWAVFADGTSTTTSVIVTGLTKGMQYKLRVAAVNAVGQSLWSTATSGTWVL